MNFRIEHGDCLELLWREPACSFDSMVTDPPAGIGFMGRDWDRDKGGRNRWIAWLAERMYAAKRVLKPGAHGLVWALPRTAHWTGMALEDGGFEVRDCISHVFGSGMPKSLNVAKAIQSGSGRPEDIRRMDMGPDYVPSGRGRKNYDSGAGSAMNGARRGAELGELAQRYAGVGTALKPSHELWFLVRKPLDGTVASNVLTHGTGGINIDACRVAHASPADFAAHDAGVKAIKARGGSMAQSWKNASDLSGANDVSGNGRWPPNFLLTHHCDCKRVGSRAVKANPTWDTPNRDTEASAFTGSEVSAVRHASAAGTEEVPVWECVEGCPVREMDAQSGESTSSGGVNNGGLGAYGFGHSGTRPGSSAGGLGDTGTASRYFPQFEWSALDDITPFIYSAKASRAERERGLEHFKWRAAHGDTPNPQGIQAGTRNVHPTVKNGELMRYLCRLVTPPGGTVIDPFTGSGSTGVAALLEGLRFLGCELSDTDDDPFVSIARARCSYVTGREFVPRASLRVTEPPKQRNLFTTGGDT